MTLEVARIYLFVTTIYTDSWAAQRIQIFKCENKWSNPTKYFAGKSFICKKKKCQDVQVVVEFSCVTMWMGPGVCISWYFILGCILWPFWLSKIAAKHVHNWSLLGTGFHRGLDLSHVSKFVTYLRVNCRRENLSRIGRIFLPLSIKRSLFWECNFFNLTSNLQICQDPDILIGRNCGKKSNPVLRRPPQQVFLHAP